MALATRRLLLVGPTHPASTLWLHETLCAVPMAAPWEQQWVRLAERLRNQATEGREAQTLPHRPQGQRPLLVSPPQRRTGG